MSDVDKQTQDTAKISLLEQSKHHLREFFQNQYVKSLVPILVPGVLAAALLPIFGPVAAGTAAAVAIKNSLALLKIDMSTETIGKILKPIEGKKLDEDEMQTVITDTLKDLLPKDKQMNEEAAKALVTVAPEIKEAALNNPKLDTEWLGTSLETNLKEQGEMMAKIAPDIHTLILKEGQALEVDVQHLLQNWSRISVEVTAVNKSKVSSITSKAEAEGGQIGHRVAAQDESTIEGVNIDSKIS